MEGLTEAIGAVILVAGIIIIVFILAKYNYMIKKSMIENGQEVVNNTKSYNFLDYGCIVMGIGLGLLVSTIFYERNFSEDMLDLLVWGTILIFGALGLIAAYFIRRKLDR